MHILDRWMVAADDVPILFRKPATAPPSLLVVDDDPDLRDLLERYLRGNGYRVSTAADAAGMERQLSHSPPHLIILDLMLPGTDGLTIARGLRLRSSLPIIMLSARAEDIDRIVGLEVGVDDYLAKPFNPRELLARIRAVLRRMRPETEILQGARNAGLFRFGPYCLDTPARRLSREGQQITLTSADFKLLHLFVTHPNKVLSRDALINVLKGYERSSFDRCIDVRVARLRRKIEPHPDAPVYIRTVWGEGYLFAPDGQG